MDKAQAEQLVSSRPWWYHKFEIYPGVVTPGVYDPSSFFSKLHFPHRMDGLRVLDVGPADGYFSKRLAERGADVTAVDYMDKNFHGFEVMEKLHGSPIKFLRCNIYDISSLGLEAFNIVLCFGVLYHLPDMPRAIWTLRSLTSDFLLLETHVSRMHEDKPIAEYLPGSSCNNDPTNFWAPNPCCTEKMLEDAGFDVVETVELTTNRFFFRAKVSDAAGAGHKLALAYR